MYIRNNKANKRVNNALYKESLHSLSYSYTSKAANTNAGIKFFNVEFMKRLTVYIKNQ